MAKIAPTSRRIVIPLAPVPASRPRVSKWGTYYGKTYTKWRKAAEKCVPPAHGTIDTPVLCAIVLNVPRPKSGKLILPKGDGDNYEKATLDLLQKLGYLKDDTLVEAALWVKRYIPHGESGSTVIHLLDSEPPLGPDKLSLLVGALQKELI